MKPHTYQQEHDVVCHNRILEMLCIHSVMYADVCKGKFSDYIERNKVILMWRISSSGEEKQNDPSVGSCW